MENDTQKYIIMELMDEGSLKTFLATVKRGDGPGQLQLDQSHFTYIAAQVRGVHHGPTESGNTGP